MNQYLLLRDNKQTGPYTVEELAAKGLKAYDLVWLEGKSAAWRYPSEIAELKPYAPVVEEQPYDRFYKKPVEESHPLLEKARNAALKEARKETAITKAITPVEVSQQQNVAETQLPILKETVPEKQEPAEEEKTVFEEEPEIPAQTNIHPKKIYVTLPASNGNGAKKTAKKTAASFSQTISTVTEERPVIELPKKKPEPDPVPLNDTYSDFEKTTDKDLYAQMQENARSRPQRKNTARPVMAVLVAACLLLFGVIIGLYISNMKQQGQNRALEDLVKQIQLREQNREASAPVTPPVEPVQEMQQSAIDSTNGFNNEIKDTEKKMPVSSVARKGNSTPDNKQQAVVPSTKTENEELVKNAAVQEEESKEKITYQQAALESARKNIHQQILVENSKFKTGVLGGISNLHMTLSNNSRYPLDQVAIEIKYFGPEQKLVKTQTLLFNDLAPGEQKTLEAPRTSRGVTIDYAITRINSKVLGLAQSTQF